MPLELPRHELQVRKGTIFKEYEYAEQYDRVEGLAQKKEKAAGRDTKNPEKRAARSATSIVADAQKSLKAATTRLTEISTVQVNDLDLVSELRRQAKESSTDLAGYFNDYKLSLENKKDLSKLDIQLFELLELAEQKGGIGHWLEQWNALMRDPAQRTDVSKMADIADSIRAGIEFQMALLEQNFSKDPDLEKTVVEHYVRTHLSSIAFEISRQVSEALQGRFETGSPLSAARNALKGEDPREGQAKAIQQAVTNLFVHELIKERDGKQSSGVQLPSPEPVVVSLREWQEAATTMSALVQAIGGPNYPGAQMELSIARQLMEKQITAVNSLGEAAKEVFNQQSSLSASGYSPITKDATLFQLSHIASTLLEQHRSWAAQLKNPEAKKKLLAQVELSENVCTMIQKKREDPSLPRYYEEALAASTKGSLAEVWKQTKTVLLDQARKCIADEAVADEMVKDLSKLFSEGLRSQLDNWAARQKNPRDIRGLAWQLASTLREYQAGVEKILKKYEGSLTGAQRFTGKEIRTFLMEMVEQRAGAIRNAIAQGLEENIKAGLG